MSRRPSGNTVHLSLLTALGCLYGLLLAFTRIPRLLPLWGTLAVCGVAGVIIAAVSEPLAEAVARWREERQAVRDFERRHPKPPKGTP